MTRFKNALSGANNKIIISIVANILFTFFELAVGLLTNSLALISDGTLNISDVASLIISLIGQKIAKIKPNSVKNFGYGRATVLTALINGLILFVFSILIFYKAYERIYNPEPIPGLVVMLTGLLGLIINGASAYLIYDHNKDLNIHSAYLNMLFDALASAAALISGFIIYKTGFVLVDPIASFIIGGLLLISAYKILKKTLNIFFEGVPHWLNIEQIKAEILSEPEALAIDNFCAWALSTKTAAINVRVIIDPKYACDSLKIIKRIKAKLSEDKRITHTYIELKIKD